MTPVLEQIGGLSLEDIAAEFGTPCYIYDQASIAQQYRSLHGAFTSRYPNSHIHYAIKANANLAIIGALHRLGARMDCSSPVELALAQRAGVSPDNIMYTGNYESVEDLEAAVAAGVRVNFDDVTSLQRCPQLPARVAFRINPGIGRGGFEGIVTGGSDAKFGVPYEKAHEAYAAAQQRGVQRFGIHMMTGSNNLEPYHFVEVVDKLMEIAGAVFRPLGIQPEYIDIGGGLGIPYTDEEQPLDLENMAHRVVEVFQEKCSKFGFDKPELIIEPGRYLVGPAGYLLSRVTGTKDGYKRFVGLDVGMNSLLRPALYGAHHRLATVARHPSSERPTQVCGQVCENSDILLRNLPLPQLAAGDLVVLRDVGAYGYVMASQYNGRPRPAEILVEGGKAQLIRRRETLDDFLRGYPASLLS